MERCANCTKFFNVLKVTAYPFGVDTTIWVCSRKCKKEIEDTYSNEKEKK